MNFELFTFSRKYKRDSRDLYLYFDFDISAITGHNKSSFLGYESILSFAKINTDKRLYITKNQCGDFYEEDDKLVLNLDSYQEFSQKIGKNGENRAQAFFSRRVRHFSEDERKSIIASSKDNEILLRIRNLPQESKIKFITKLQKIEGLSLTNSEEQNNDFNSQLLLAIANPEKLGRISENYSAIQVGLLENYLIFLEKTIEKVKSDTGRTDAWETYIQNWIDAKIDNNGNEVTLTEKEKESNSRALIFGLEYINHRREVLDSGQRMDVLAKLDSNDGNREYVLIELKSPKAEIFEDEESEFKISKKLARAIPQVLDYKADFESKLDGDRDLDRYGLIAGKIVKCIIVIGTIKENDRWKKVFSQLKGNFSGMIEIITYDDLIRKLKTTILNIRTNLQ